VPAEAGLAERTEQVAQRAVAEEVERFVGHLEARLALRLADLPAHRRWLGWIVRRRNRDIVLGLHALDDLLDQLVEFAFGLHLFHLLPHFLIHQVAVQQCLADGFAQRLHGLIALAHLLLVSRELIFEAALQKMVGERLHQIFHTELIGQIGNVFRIAYSTHKKPL
jgi:hypothetical protein